MTARRFEFEQQFLNLWNILDDLKLINDHILDSKEIDRDQISNMITGIRELHELKFEKLWQLFLNDNRKEL